MINPENTEIEAPFFSIVIASLNNINCLKLCVESINIQDFSSYEVLVSDGGSTDGTKSILNSVNIRNLSWVKSSVDSGIYHALNHAFSEVKGQWILVLGSDDKLCDTGALNRAHVAIKEYQNQSHCNLFYSDLLIKSSNGTRLKKYPEFSNFCACFSGAPFIHHQTAFVSRNGVYKFGPFDTTYKIHADYDFMMRVISGSFAIKINDVFVEYNSYGYSSRPNNILRSIDEVRRIRKKLGFPELNIRLTLIYFKLLFRSIFNFKSGRF